MRRGRPPKDKTVADLPPDVQGRIREAVLSHADEASASIYRRFGLSQRGICNRTFARYAKDLREQHANERGGACSIVAVPSWAEIDERLRCCIAARIDVGNLKAYELAELVRAVRGHLRTKQTEATPAGGVGANSGAVAEAGVRT